MRALLSQPAGKWFVRLVGLLAVVVGIVNPDSLPTNVRAAFIYGAAIVLAVDRWLTDPSTGSSLPVVPVGEAPSTPAAPVAATVPAADSTPGQPPTPSAA